MGVHLHKNQYRIDYSHTYFVAVAEVFCSFVASLAAHEAPISHSTAPIGSCFFLLIDINVITEEISSKESPTGIRAALADVLVLGLAGIPAGWS